MASTRRLVVLLGVLVLLLGAVPGASAQSSPAPSASPSPIPSAAPIPTWPDAGIPGDGGLTPGVLAWEAAGEPMRSPRKQLLHLTAWRGGFAALEYREGRQGGITTAVRHSPDGRTWTRSRLPAAAHDAVALLPLKDGLVVAAYGPARLRLFGFDYVFFRSDDGVDWERAGELSYRVPPGLERQNCQANHRDFAAIDGALMLFVGMCWDPCCGSGPAPADGTLAMLAPMGAAGTPERGRGVMAWRSTDAARWRPQVLQGVRPEQGQAYGGRYGFHLHPSDGELLAIRGARTNDLIRSTDGIRWSPFGALPDTDLTGQQQPVPIGDTVLVIGEDGSSGHGNPLVTWVMEADGTTTATMARRPAWTNAVVTDGSTVLAFGRAWGDGSTSALEDDQEWAWIMGSADGGRTWDPALSWTGAAGSCISDVVRNDRTVVALACEPYRTGGADLSSEWLPFWVAELP